MYNRHLKQMFIVNLQSYLVGKFLIYLIILIYYFKITVYSNYTKRFFCASNLKNYLMKYLFRLVNR